MLMRWLEASEGLQSVNFPKNFQKFQGLLCNNLNNETQNTGSCVSIGSQNGLMMITKHNAQSALTSLILHNKGEDFSKFIIAGNETWILYNNSETEEQS